MKNTSKDTSIVRDTADQRKAKKQGTIAGTVQEQGNALDVPGHGESLPDS